MSAVSIRRAEPRDLPALQALSDALTDFDRAYDPTLTKGWPLGPGGAAYLQDTIAGRDGSAAWVAERADGSLLGMLTARVSPAPDHRSISAVAELETLWVVPSARAGGIGRRLVEAFLAWAATSGAERGSVRVSTGNASALAFYQRLGFIPYDAILELPLPPPAAPPPAASADTASPAVSGASSSAAAPRSAFVAISTPAMNLTTDALTVERRPGRGRCLVARRNFLPGERIASSPVLPLTPEDCLHLEQTLLGDYYFQWPDPAHPGAVVYGPGTFVNHDDDPNADLAYDLEDLVIHFDARRAIAAGEEVTIHYRCELWFDQA